MARIFSLRKKQPVAGAPVVSALQINPFGVGATMAAYKYGSYDNTFPSVSRIAEAFMTVIPYAQDANGDRIESTPAAVEALYHPCKEMSSIDFFETLAVCALVHPCVHILVWHNEGGKAVPGGVGATPDNICGYTFLENAVRIVTGGIVTYQTAFGTFSDQDVISVRLNANPYAVLDGYSPSIAAMKWSRLDDFMAEYQAGFFRNGAVPAGEFIITTNDAAEYEDIVNKLKATTVGVEKNNKVLYIHRPAPLAGETQPAKIEWVPFSQKNSELSINQLFEEVNRKIDMTFGVPAEVNGFISNSNYASVSTADYIFSRRVVYPKLVKIWSRFTHELNRITGGLGYSIGFDYDMPMLADETKVKADTAQKQLEVYLTALSNGINPEDAVRALGLPERFADMKVKLPESTSAEPTEESEPDEEQPAEEDGGKKSIAKGKCEHCGEAKMKEIVEEVVATEEHSYYIPGLYDDLERRKREIAERVLLEKKYKKEAEKKRREQAMLFWMLIIVFATAEGQEAYEATLHKASEAGLSLPPEALNHTYVPNAELLQVSMEKFLGSIYNFEDTTGIQIEAILKQADEAGFTDEQKRRAVDDYINADRWRTNRFATTEGERWTWLAQVDAASQLQDILGDAARIVKVWHTSGLDNVCEDCRRLDGEELPVKDAFVGAYERMPAGDINDYLPILGPGAHPNCHCWLEIKVYKTSKSVIVKCPKCGRYLMDAKSCAIDKLICTNSSCKAHLKLCVANGETKIEVIEKEA